jgi:hypothetical protein
MQSVNDISKNRNAHLSYLFLSMYYDRLYTAISVAALNALSAPSKSKDCMKFSILR